MVTLCYAAVGRWIFTAALRGPLRVRALVRVRCPRIGNPERWRLPRQVPRSINRLMFMDTSRRRSPSVVNRATCSRSFSMSESDRSLILVAVPTPAAAQIARAAAADAENRRQRDFSVLMIWYVDATYAGHLSPHR